MKGVAAGRPSWHFHIEPSGTVFGNDASLFHFQGQGDAGWVRELMQNSLDVRADPESPVEIELSQQMVPAEDVDLEGLMMAIRRCLKNPDRVGKAEKMLQQACSRFDDSDEIVMLCYEERNTLGARMKDGTWEALTRAEGISSGKNESAMGVYGIGKNAAYTASPLHAVVYVTRYTEGMKSEQRMIGRASLSSHYGDDDKLRQPKGWLGKDEGRDLEGEDIPVALRRDRQGLSIYILGTENLEEQAEKYLAKTAAHYFPAIHYGSLTVGIRRHRLNKSTIRTYFDLATGVEGQRALRGLNAISEGKREEKHIPGVGNVRVCVKREEEGEKSVIFLVRGSGLVITRNLTHMGDARPYVDNGKCLPYTAVIHVLDTEEGDGGWVRQCENPAHDRIELENIMDEETRKAARRDLRELAGWVKEQIEKVVARPMGPNHRNATELAHYLPMPDLFQDTDESGETGKGERFAFSTPKRINSSSSPLGRVADPQVGRKESNSQGREEVGPDNPDGEGRGHRLRGGSGETSNESKQNNTRAVYRCDGVRILPHAENETHRVRIAFNAPSGGNPEIRLFVIGEDGGHEETSLSGVDLVSVGKKKPTEEGIEMLGDRRSFRLKGTRAGERMEVEIVLLEPSQGQAYDLTWREAVGDSTV